MTLKPMHLYRRTVCHVDTVCKIFILRNSCGCSVRFKAFWYSMDGRSMKILI